jgi:hypothetical protein
MEPVAVILTLDTRLLEYNTHYTIGGTLNKTITMVVAPVLGQTLFARYMRENGE